mmetsp:Transcript_15286/g.38614  ORF Transcript_15286/g.38614 Transcript_15286/m.38614 type:complete len:150 (+) Transcript_15286:2836-3285(+)
MTFRAKGKKENILICSQQVMQRLLCPFSPTRYVSFPFVFGNRYSSKFFQICILRLKVDRYNFQSKSTHAIATNTSFLTYLLKCSVDRASAVASSWIEHSLLFYSTSFAGRWSWRKGSEEQRDKEKNTKTRKGRKPCPPPPPPPRPSHGS